MSPNDAPYVVLRLPDGGHCRLVPGDRIGRHWRNTLVLTDQRISEAHAMVSVRGGVLRLINLRGGLAVGGTVTRDPLLTTGMTLAFAPGFEVEVREVRQPGAFLALEGTGLPSTRLGGGTMSLHTGSPTELVVGYRPSASAWLFDDGQQWWFATSEERRPLEAGDTVTVGTWRGRITRIELDNPPTTLENYPTTTAVRLECMHDVVRIYCGGRLALQLAGRQARLLCELAEIGTVVHWAGVASALWPEDEPWQVRRRWDTLLCRLRRRLSDAGIRSDLIASDGRGGVGLVVHPGDTVSLE